MSFKIKAPSPGESISEIILASWYKKDGDAVEENEIIAEMESEKANLEITAEKSGILNIKVAEGETISVGDTIAIIEEKAVTDSSLAKEPIEKEPIEQENNNLSFEDSLKQKSDTVFTDKKVQPLAESQEKSDTVFTDKNAQPLAESQEKSVSIEINFDVVIPSPGESISEVTIGTWVKKDGDFVQKDEEILEVESEKANLSINAEISGILNIKLKEGIIAKVGDIAAVIKQIEQPVGAEQATPTAQEKVESTAKTEQPTFTTKEKTAPTMAIASPAAQKMMKEQDINIISGSGKGDRITKQDILLATQTQKTTKKQDISQPFTDPVEKNLTSRKLEAELTQFTTEKRKVKKQNLSSMRKTIAKKLHSVQQETAMLTTFNEVNMDAIFQIRKNYKDIFLNSYDIKLGFLSFFVKASCLALLEFPNVNSQIDLEKGEQSFFNYVDMGIAVSAPKGLIVPVLRNTHKLSLANIEKEIIALAKKARAGKIQLDEMTGGTFTITNGGVFGSMLSTPILNSPQSAILGMHNIIPRAIVVDGEVQVANIMYLALTYDHRVIDGKDAVRFLVSIKNYLEDPVRMLLGV